MRGKPAAKRCSKADMMLMGPAGVCCGQQLRAGHSAPSGRSARHDVHSHDRTANPHRLLSVALLADHAHVAATVRAAVVFVIVVDLSQRQRQSRTCRRLPRLRTNRGRTPQARQAPHDPPTPALVVTGASGFMASVECFSSACTVGIRSGNLQHSVTDTVTTAYNGDDRRSCCGWRVLACGKAIEASICCRRRAASSALLRAVALRSAATAAVASSISDPASASSSASARGASVSPPAGPSRACISASSRGISASVCAVPWCSAHSQYCTQHLLFTHTPSSQDSACLSFQIKTRAGPGQAAGAWDVRTVSRVNLHRPQLVCRS